MKKTHRWVVLCWLVLSPVRAIAQDDISVRLEAVRVGFQAQGDDRFPRFKVGMWAPVYVTLKAGKDGFPAKGATPPRIHIETSDSEDIGTIYTVETRPLAGGESATFLGYVRTGNLASPVKVSVVAEGHTLAQQTLTQRAANLGSLLVVTLGGRVEALERAVEALDIRRDDPLGGETTMSKFAAFETEAAHLPDLGFGYEGVDLLILCTGNTDFLADLKANAARIGALSHYVRHGGHLVVPVAWQNQELVHAILTSDRWQPPVPSPPPSKPGPIEDRSFARLPDVENWGLVESKPFRGEPDPIVVARLHPDGTFPPAWDVQARKEKAALIARMPYGRGNITLLAFALEKGPPEAPPRQPPWPFSRWDGGRDFLKTMITKLTPREASVARDRIETSRTDVASDLQRVLDTFDVRQTPFGLVAFLIIVYILIVGPLDYLVLKYVLKRLDWTWFTFPAVVLGATVAAYYSAAALKGREQKVNQVDIIDFDLRTDLDDQLRTRKAFVYGQSFFTVYSPRIHAYPIGLTLNPAFWGEGHAGLGQPVSWLGRPDGEAWGMGRRGSQGPARKPYRYAPQARSLEDVPIAIWATKSFQAGWETSLQKLPFEADLAYHQRPVAGRDLRVSGTFKNNLPEDLYDVWFIHGDRAFALGQPMKAGETLKIGLESHQGRDLGAWASSPDPEIVAANIPGGPRSTTAAIKSILFHDKTRFGGVQNHALRRLDQSWRLETKLRAIGLDASVHEAIVYARLKQKHVLAGDDPRGSVSHANLPTRLWLDRLPEIGGAIPEMTGALTQDAFLRIYLPLHPADK